MPSDLDALFDWRLLLAVAVVFLAGALRGFSGFGSALLLTPSLSALYGPLAAVPMVVVLEVVQAFQLLPAAWRQCERKSALLLSLACLATIPLGVWLLTATDPTLLRWAISGGILLFLALLLAGVRRKGPLTLPGLAAAGAASGLANGIAGVGGPPVALYYLAGDTAAAVVRATIIVFYFVMDAATLGYMGAVGLIDLPLLLASLVVFPAAALGVWLGSHLFSRASERAFRLVALSLIGAVAIVSAAVG